MNQANMMMTVEELQAVLRIGRNGAYGIVKKRMLTQVESTSKLLKSDSNIASSNGPLKNGLVVALMTRLNLR